MNLLFRYTFKNAITFKTVQKFFSMDQIELGLVVNFRNQTAMTWALVGRDQMTNVNDMDKNPIWENDVVSYAGLEWQVVWGSSGFSLYDNNSDSYITLDDLDFIKIIGTIYGDDEEGGLVDDEDEL